MWSAKGEGEGPRQQKYNTQDLAPIKSYNIYFVHGILSSSQTGGGFNFLSSPLRQSCQSLPTHQGRGSILCWGMRGRARLARRKIYLRSAERVGLLNE